MGFDGTPSQNHSLDGGELMFSAFNLNNPPCGRLSNHNQTTPLDDRTQKQILKLKKEMGALSKDKAVLE